MAKIQSITFNRFGKNEGCTCSKCGKYITNVFTVKLTTGEYLNYGTTCFPKLQKEGINKDLKRKFKKALEFQMNYIDKLEAYTSGKINEENDIAFQFEKANNESCWYGKSFEEYKNWMVNEFLPYRISIKNEEIAKLGNILEI